MGDVEAKHRVEVPEPQKGEELNVAFHAHEEQETPEGEDPQVLTQLIVEEAEEDLVEDHEHKEGEWYHHDEILNCAPEEEAILPLDLGVLVIGGVREVGGE